MNSKDAAFAIPGAQWKPVSKDLIKVRLISASISSVIFVAVAVTLAILLTPWIWIAAGLFAALWIWQIFLIPRQVRAISYAELPDDLAVRAGIIFRTLTLVPYGRMQYVDVQAGPLLRHFKIANVTLHTASADTDASIPGLPAAEAGRLRDQLTERGEAKLAGL